MDKINLKKLTSVLICIAIGSIVNGTYAAGKPLLEIGTWAHFCRCAYTHTFDDNTPNQTAVAQALFDEKGFKMTLFTITGSSQFPADWEALKNAHAFGHEIASHSVTHQRGMDESELEPSRKVIQKNVPGEQCVTIAYPYCMKPDEREVATWYIGGRVCDDKIEERTPGNFYEISSFLCGGGNLTGAEAFNRKAVDAAENSGWCVLLHHGVGEGDHISSNTAVEDISGNLEYLEKNRDWIWVEHFGNVIRYIKERDAAEIKYIDSSFKDMRIRITDTLPDSIFNYPLSLRCRFPEGWDDISVMQNGKNVEDSVVAVNERQFIMFEAVPDAGEILIKNGAAKTSNRYKIKRFGVPEVEIYRKSDRISIRLPNTSTKEVTIMVYDILGRTVLSHSTAYHEIELAIPVGIRNGTMCIITIDHADYSVCQMLTPCAGR